MIRLILQNDLSILPPSFLHYFLKQGRAAWPGFFISQMCGFIPLHRGREKWWNRKVGREKKMERSPAEEQKIYHCTKCGCRTCVHGNACRTQQLSLFVCEMCVRCKALTSLWWFLAGWWVFLSVPSLCSPLCCYCRCRTLGIVTHCRRRKMTTTTGDLHRDRGPILSMEYSYVWVTVPKLTEFTGESVRTAAGQH